MRLIIVSNNNTSFINRGYISQELFERLYKQGLQLITRYKKKMKQKLVKLVDKILLRKRSLIETVNDQLKGREGANKFEIRILISNSDPIIT